MSLAKKMVLAGFDISPSQSQVFKNVYESDSLPTAPNNFTPTHVGLNYYI